MSRATNRLTRLPSTNRSARTLLPGRLSVLVSVAVAALVVALPKLALACAVCTSGREDESNTAFLISTIFLSLLPLAGLGTLVFVLWRRIRALEAQRGDADGASASVANVATVASVSSTATSLPVG